MLQLDFYKKRQILRSIQTGNIDILKKFKEDYPDVHWCELRYDKSGTTVLHVVSRLGFANIVDYLLTNYTPSGVDCRDRDGKTALHEAAQFARVDVVKTLIKHRAQVNALKRGDWTPLMLACTKQAEKSVNNNDLESDRFQCVDLLLSAGTDPLIQNKDGWTAFHMCSREGFDELLMTLICTTYSYHEGSHNGRTALHVAVLHGHAEATEMILSSEAYINKRDNCGHTPLHDSILSGNLEIFNILVMRGANVDDVTEEGLGILHIAASWGRLDFIEHILENQYAQIDTVTNTNLTALHCAARNKQIQAYDYLIKRGAQTDIKDSFGRLPMDYLNIRG